MNKSDKKPKHNPDKKPGKPLIFSVQEKNGGVKTVIVAGKVDKVVFGDKVVKGHQVIRM